MMDPNQSCPDVLSKVPNDVIDEILMHLPFRDAVCTSILSKEWRKHWCRLPQLTFDSDFWKLKKDIQCLTCDKRATKDLTSNFTTTIHNIIARHSGPVTKCTLCIQYWKIYPPIDNLLYFLSRNRIQHLVLRLPRQLKLPPSFFTCLNLRHMFLQNCLLLPPPDFKGFDRLISLELHEVIAKGQEIPKKLFFDLLCVKHLCMCIYLDRDEILCPLSLIRSFPFLQYLEIQMEHNFKKNMSALECLEVEAFPDVIFKHLREVKLIEANVSIREMQLMKLLLAMSPVLVRMVISPHRFLGKSAIVKTLAKLAEFECASPKAEIFLKLI
ncbi:hypothetical protein KY290_027382 [Solanum tuberosum]|uniref:F-box domain-containing protein n=1 Tax=Solanum tuberosum TaxID=4113 RepID=A0ABQ7UI50_SOLTU|nr:hypothetical protein KY290_027382 [Solanum tuberosum]